MAARLGRKRPEWIGISSPFEEEEGRPVGGAAGLAASVGTNVVGAVGHPDGEKQ